MDPSSWWFGDDEQRLGPREKVYEKTDMEN